LPFSALRCKKYGSQQAPKQAPALFLFLVLLSAHYASAQQTYTPFTLGARPGDAPPQACVDTAHTIAPIITRYPHPAQWRWIIACNDRSWDALLQHLGWDARGKYTIALTDQKAHITYIRAEAMAPEAEDIVAHELAHIYLHSGDEQRVDAQAVTWIKNAHCAEKENNGLLAQR
jgi:hypothetical protein